MPKATMTLTVLVTLDVPAEQAAKVSKDDLIYMARCALPDSGTHPRSAPDGVQVTIDDCCQEDAKGEPIFADVWHVEHDQMTDVDVDLEDEGFTRAEPA